MGQGEEQAVYFRWNIQPDLVNTQMVLESTPAIWGERLPPKRSLCNGGGRGDPRNLGVVWGGGGWIPRSGKNQSDLFQPTE